MVKHGPYELLITEGYRQITIGLTGDAGNPLNIEVYWQCGGGVFLWESFTLHDVKLSVYDIIGEVLQIHVYNPNSNDVLLRLDYYITA